MSCSARQCLVAYVVVLCLLCIPAYAVCPSADVTGDCKVDMKDLAALVGQWLEDGRPDPDVLEWVYIDDPGVGEHEGFTGYMSKHEITNAQFCVFLNDALAQGEIVVRGNLVFSVEDPNSEREYLKIAEGNTGCQISYTGSVFTVLNKDSYSMANHPVTVVSWYGAKAFCDHYGYRLPTNLEWQAVADYDGSFTYGCGSTIDTTRANYDQVNPLGLSSVPFTSPVGYYGTNGYGLCDMAGNVMEWTETVHPTNSGMRGVLGGHWDSGSEMCIVSKRYFAHANQVWRDKGFRVCYETAQGGR